MDSHSPIFQAPWAFRGHQKNYFHLGGWGNQEVFGFFGPQNPSRHDKSIDPVVFGQEGQNHAGNQRLATGQIKDCHTAHPGRGPRPEFGVP